MSSKPRPFQKEVLKHLMAGRSVILQAPTGAGKTRAALDPFLQNLAHQADALPRTCRYVVPMRVLANQFFREYDARVQHIDNYVDTRLTEIYRELGRPITAIQTGEQPDDPQFESVLTFCTIDQLLASLLAIPYGIGNNRANINVGAILSSYLVLDEFHLYPLSRDGKGVFGARTTVLHLLRLLKSITPFVLMTATFSSTLLEKLATLLDAVVVNVTDEELEEIAQGRRRTFYRSPAPMNAEAILAEHTQREGNRCTLIVCNTVLRAQRLFLDLRQAERHGTRVVLLHSRFTGGDRKRLSEEIEAALGPQQWHKGQYHGPDIIVIATQVVEVGLDISVEALHTENAPTSSLIQRAGRCARFAQQQGRVLVYPLPFNEKGQEMSTAPYNKDICIATWNALAQFDGQVVGFREEQQLIDKVHTEEDNDLLTRYDANEREILDSIFESLRHNERGVASDLIRDVSQVQVLIHDEPEEVITKNPWQWESFSLRPTTFLNAERWQWMLEQGQERGWACKQLQSLLKQEEHSLPDGPDGLDNREQIHYTWEPITNPAQIRKALMIALPSEVATYDSELGFLLRDDFPDYVQSGIYQSSIMKKASRHHQHGGSRQTSYQGHIAGLVRAYHWNIKEDIAYAVRQLEKAMELPTGMVDQAILLAIACHDLGKLDNKWQQWAYAWQKLRRERHGMEGYELPSPDFCFAKTDYDYSDEERAWQRDVMPKRPRHACESVAIGRSLIGASLGISKTGGRERMPVLRAACGAIAHHHSSQASEYAPVKLSAQAVRAAQDALSTICEHTQWGYDISRLKTEIPKRDDLSPASGESKLTRPAWEQGRRGELETWLYFVIVHALRLSDQRADLF